MKSIFVICLVNFATLNNFLEANTRCAQKPNIRQIPLPTLAETYSATYEYTHSHITSILEENYDEKTDRVSLSMYVGNTTAQIFQSRDKTKELFKVEEGTCKQIQWDAKDFSFIDNFRKHTGIKHMLFLKEIIALSKAKKTIYLGRKKIFNDEIEVDAWEHCINGAAVRIYWTLKTEKTPASEIYPIKIWIKTPYKDDEYIYIFKFLPHHINETAINPPEEIFCPGRYNNRPMNGTLFLGNDMVFTSEVADPLNKRIYRTKHYYLIKQNLAQIIMPDLTVKPSMSQRYVPTYRYVFEYNLGEYYRIDIHTRKCTHNLISKFKEEVGEMFIMHQSTFENMKSLLDPEKVFYAGQAWTRGLQTRRYQGYLTSFPPGVQHLFTVLNWYIVEQDANFRTVPISLSLYIYGANANINGPARKLTFDFYDWKKYEADQLELYNFEIRECIGNFVYMKFALDSQASASEILQNGDIYLLRNRLATAVAKATGISVLRVMITEVRENTSRTKLEAYFLLYDKPPTTKPNNRHDIPGAIKALKKAITNGEVSAATTHYDKTKIYEVFVEVNSLVKVS